MRVGGSSSSNEYVEKTFTGKDFPVFHPGFLLFMYTFILPVHNKFKYFGGRNFGGKFSWKPFTNSEEARGGKMQWQSFQGIL